MTAIEFTHFWKRQSNILPPCTHGNYPYHEATCFNIKSLTINERCMTQSIGLFSFHEFVQIKTALPIIYMWFIKQFNENRKCNGEENDKDGFTVAVVVQQVQYAVHQSYCHSTSSGRTSRDKGIIDFLSTSIDNDFRMSRKPHDMFIQTKRKPESAR